MLSRVPRPELLPFVSLLWASEAKGAAHTAVSRELVLPTGDTHLAIRLSDPPLRVFGAHGADAEDSRVETEVGHAVVGGARAGFYVRDVSQPVRSVGAQLRPGAARLLFGAPACELSGRHTELSELWGRAAAETRERIAEAGPPAAQLDVFESILLARLPAPCAPPTIIVQALRHLERGGNVAAAVAESGLSHRSFNVLFREAVGLTPKLHCRVRRFGLALDRVAQGTYGSWAELAAFAGYSDQAHFNRDFREFAGLSPSRYRALSPAFARHVSLPAEARDDAGQKRSRRDPVR